MGTYNKIIINDEVILDLSSDTITTNNLLEGVTAHDATGMQITGKIKKYNKEYTGSLEILEPTMYSYNGTVLPKLPEWDKTAYPYAVILDNKRLFVSRNPFIVSADSTKAVLVANSAYAFYDILNETEWVKAFEGIQSIMNNAIGVPLWTNADIEGLLEATEPIPVYE